MSNNQKLTNGQIIEKKERGIYMAKVVSKSFRGWVDIVPVKLVDYIKFYQEDTDGYFDTNFWLKGSAEYQKTIDELMKLRGNNFYLRLGYHEENKHCLPVNHINWLEAKAFARWRKSNLPNISILENLTQHLFNYDEMEKINPQFIDDLEKDAIIKGIPIECIKFSKYGTIHLGAQWRYLNEWVNGKNGASKQQTINFETITEFLYYYTLDNVTFRCIMEA